MTERQLGLLMAIITALCWAVLAIALKYSSFFANTGNIVWLRMTTAFLVLFFLFYWKKREYLKILRRPPLLAILAGLALAINYFGFMKGVELTTAGNTQIMIQSAPMMLILVGVFYFKETLRGRQLVGVLLASAGFAFFYWDQIILSFVDKEKYFTGNLWIYLAAITWVLFASFQKMLSKKISPQEVNLIIYFVAAIGLFPLSQIQGLASLSLFQWSFLIALGLNTIVAYGALGEALKRIPASHVSLIIALNPLLTLCLLKAMELLNIQWIPPEPVSWRGYFGALLVFSGVAITVFIKSPRLRSS